MEQANKVAIARFVMRSKQYLAVLRPKDGTLLLSMMVYADEINSPETIPEFDELESVSVDTKELAMAESLIESLSEEFDPEEFHDEYRQKVLDLIDRKAEGEDIVAEITPAPSADKVVDLMAALEASVKEAKKARSRHPTALPVESETKSTKKSSKRPAKKKPAKSASKSSSKSKSRTKSAKSKSPAKTAKSPAKRKSA